MAGLQVGLNQQRKCNAGTGTNLSLEVGCPDSGVHLFREGAVSKGGFLPLIHLLDVL